MVGIGASIIRPSDPKKILQPDYIGGNADEWDILNMPTASTPPVVP